MSASATLANAFLVLRFDFSMIEVGTLAEIERNFFDHVRLSVQSFAVRYRALADWSSALAAENPAMMIDRLRGVVQCEGLPPLYVIVDEYDNFTNELVVSNRDAEYDAVCGHDNVGGPRAAPDAETVAQARRYRDSLFVRSGWCHAVETVVVEVYGNRGYRWFPVDSTEQPSDI